MAMKSWFVGGAWKRHRWKSLGRSQSLEFHYSAYYKAIKDTNTKAKTGRLEEARRVFDEMPHRTAGSWNTMISAYLKKGQSSQAPSDTIKDTNTTISYMAKTGRLEEARRVFDQMPHRTAVSWNTMISAYSKRGQFSQALSLLSSMHCSGMKMNDGTSCAALSACARQKLSMGGQEIHCIVVKSGLESFEYVGSSLVYFYSCCHDIGNAGKVFDEFRWNNNGYGSLWSSMLVGYVNCNLMNDALSVFDEIPCPRVYDWTTLISGYSKSDEGCKKALELFQMMRECSDAVPNEFTLDSVIRACGRSGALQGGRAVHGLVVKLGFESELSNTGALVDFYCSDNEVIDDAKKVYGTLDNPCLTASNNLMGALVNYGRIEEAEVIFDGLAERNPVSYGIMIKGYALHGRLEDSKRLFMRMPDRSLNCTNTMIHALSKSGEVHRALELFEEIKGEGSSVTWNSMISGYVENEQHESAIELYKEMRRFSITHTRFTFSALFRACSWLGSLEQGQQIHGPLIKTPFESSVYVRTALVDMYSKCGSISDAHSSFLHIACPNVVAWTSLIHGFAHHGLGSEAISLYNQMLGQGVCPNATTFTAVLSACNVSGLVKEGMAFFRSMKQCYGVSPSLEHYTCLVDLLCRSGMLKEAEELLKEMPFEADEVLMITLLNSYWSRMDIDAGERVAKKMLSLSPNIAPTCVIMSNIYAGLGQWREKVKARNLMANSDKIKDPGCSWIGLDNRIHTFYVDDRTHPESAMIYATLKFLTASVESFAQFSYFGSDIMETAILSSKS